MSQNEPKTEVPHDILEEAGIAYDPTTQHLDLTKDEKRRTTALMLAIQAYQKLIIPDADYLREAAKLAKHDKGPQIEPATIDAMVDAAIKFDAFIEGKFRETHSGRSASDDEADRHAQTASGPGQLA